MKRAKIIFASLIVGVGFILVSACSERCPSGYNTTDPSCPGYNPYGNNQGYQQPYYGPQQQQYNNPYGQQYQQPYYGPQQQYNNPYGQPRYCGPYGCRAVDENPAE